MADVNFNNSISNINFDVSEKIQGTNIFFSTFLDLTITGYSAIYDVTLQEGNIDVSSLSFNTEKLQIENRVARIIGLPKRYSGYARITQVRHSISRGQGFKTQVELSSKYLLKDFNGGSENPDEMDRVLRIVDGKLTLERRPFGSNDNTKIVAPIDGGQIPVKNIFLPDFSSTTGALFGKRIYNNVEQFHYGFDLATRDAPIPSFVTPTTWLLQPTNNDAVSYVYPPEDLMFVSGVGFDSGGGNYVFLTDVTGSYQVRFFHLGYVNPGVVNGKPFPSKLFPIAISGFTGTDASGPHTHMEILVLNKETNKMKQLLSLGQETEAQVNNLGNLTGNVFLNANYYVRGLRNNKDRR